MAVGIFGVTEILRNLENEDGRDLHVKHVGRLMLSREDIKRIVAPVLRGTVVGSVLGVLPGGGAVLASFASYAVEKRASSTPERFGHGAIEGVAGPESANNAAAQTSFIPMLALGIPGNPVMAIISGALILKGIVPGPNVATEHPELFWGIIASMWLGNLMLVILNLPLIGLWVWLLRVPYYSLFPAIMAFSAIGVYGIQASAFDMFTVAAFGGMGYLLYKLGCEPTPLLLGFVLGPMLEEHLRRALIISHGDPTIFFDRPISRALLLIAFGVLLIMILPSVMKRRNEVFADSE